MISRLHIHWAETSHRIPSVIRQSKITIPLYKYVCPTTKHLACAAFIKFDVVTGHVNQNPAWRRHQMETISVLLPIIP